MKKKLGILMAAVIFALTAFAGCGNSSSASSGNNGIKILLSLNEMDDFRQTLVDGATAAAAEQGIQLDVKDADYFESQGVRVQHGGGNLFAEDEEIMSWLFDR